MDRRDFGRGLIAAAAPAWALGFDAARGDAEPLAMTVHGRLPAGLRGSFYRNGPAGHAPGGVRRQHQRAAAGRRAARAVGRRLGDAARRAHARDARLQGLVARDHRAAVSSARRST